MAYKIAVVSGDGVNIDLSFGAALVFDIYEAEGKEYHLIEKREYRLPEEAASDQTKQPDDVQAVDGKGCGNENRCKNSRSSGCGAGGGCGGTGESFSKVQLISDCRCVICKKIGFNIQKQLEKLAITGFDVECTVEEALSKITAYLDKIDRHQSLRGIQSRDANA